MKRRTHAHHLIALTLRNTLLHILGFGIFIFFIKYGFILLLFSVVFRLKALGMYHLGIGMAGTASLTHLRQKGYSIVYFVCYRAMHYIYR